MTKKNIQKVILIVAVFVMILGAAIFVVLNKTHHQGNDSGKPGFTGITLPENIPPEKIVLTVKGKIRKATPALFDLKTIRSFQPVTFTTFDPWDQQEQTYQGVPIIDVLEFLEMDESAEDIEVVAKNEYTIVINIKDLRRYNHIFSYAMNDKLYKEYEGSQNKGPLAIAIDFSGNSDIDIEIYKHQLVWLVDTVTVR